MRLLNVIAMSLLFGASIASAEIIAERAPYSGGPFGQQSDANTPAYVQSVVPSIPTVLTSITWWGYHGIDSIGSISDDFIVALNGTPVVGVLSVNPFSPSINQYVLTFDPWSGTASSLSISNQGVDVEWYWQSAETLGGAHAFDVSYRLEGRSGSVSSPMPALLLSVGVVALVRSRIRRRESVLDCSDRLPEAIAS